MAGHSTTNTPESGRKGTFSLINPDGDANLVVVCEHASNFIPPIYADLGLSTETLQTHIAWDPGALAVAEILANRLDAPLIRQNVSRLVYDCNRPPDAEAAMPPISEIYPVPGNDNLAQQERAARAQTFYQPFRDALAGLIAHKSSGQRQPALVTVHSFNPTYMQQVRDYGLGILHDRDQRLADLLLAQMQTENRLDVRRNMPYGPADGVTHTLQVHALPRQLPNVMLEIRNDLIATPNHQTAMAEWLADHLSSALTPLSGEKSAEQGGRTFA